MLCLELRDTTVVSPYVIRFNETVIQRKNHLSLSGRVESLQGTPLTGVPVQIGHWQHDDEGSYFFIRIETATDSAGHFRIATDIRPEESLIVESPLETRFFQIGEALDGHPCDR
jgi:protocatechuate 3,4-dioxygenase beta subunit